jgi:signal transduction histidine kinase
VEPVQANVSRTISWLAGVIACFIALALPLFYFISSYRAEEAVLDVQAEINARIASQVVNAAPTLWRFQPQKLQENLNRRPRTARHEVRRILDLDGQIIAASGDPLSAPVIWQRADLLDSGVKVGTVEVGRSLQPILLRTLAFALLGALLGFGSFVILQIFPLNELRRVVDENARLIDALKQQVAEVTAAEIRLKSLHEINLATTSTLDFPAVLQVLMEKVSAYLPHCAIHIWLVNPESKQLERTASLNIDDAAWKRRPLEKDPPLVTEVMTSRMPVIVANVQSDPRTLDPEFYRGQGLVSYLGVPLVAKGEAVGDLVLLTREERHFSNEEIEFLCTLTGPAAIAIHNSQLYEQIRRQAAELERSNTELEQFAYVASHDLQEPLRMITGYTKLLAKRYKGKLDKDADDFIGFAVDGAQRMHSLIQDLLILSRVGTRGKEFAPTDCEMVLSDTLVNLQAAIQESNATITHDPLPNVMADSGQLAQVFQNLIGNAIKYRGARAPLVHVSCQSRANEWLFSVKDNGIGIDPKHAERVFVMFQRLHTRREYPGTGIGLALCKKIVERHGGKIWVESQEGAGATFYFTLRNRQE